MAKRAMKVMTRRKKTAETPAKLYFHKLHPQLFLKYSEPLAYVFSGYPLEESELESELRLV